MMSVIDVEKVLNKNSTSIGENKSYQTRKETFFIIKSYLQNKQMKNLQEGKIWNAYPLRSLMK